MGGGLGGKQTTKVSLPSWLTDAARQAVAQSQQSAQIGYMPWRGPDVAALAPGQVAAMQGTNQAAQAFGLPTAQSVLPAPQTFAGGVQGYSSAPMLDAAIAQISPKQRAAYDRVLPGILGRM